MKWWNKYKQIAEQNLFDHSYQSIGLSYWRDRLFVSIIIYLVPLGLIALVPGVIMSIKGNIPLLGFFDVLLAAFLVVIAFYRGFSLNTRKILLVSCLYLLSLVLLVYLGSYGPGLLYLMAITIFITLIFPVSVAYWSIAVNVLICILFATGMHFQLLNSPLTNIYSAGSWIAVTSNLVFLSTVCVFSFNLLFKGLHDTLVKKENLQNQLQEESKLLEKMLEEMEVKNQELEQFAYIASHDLQEPLKNISLLAGQLEDQYHEKLDENGKTYLQFLIQSSSRMKALITGLLDYSRIGREKAKELVDCNKLVIEVMDDLSGLIRENNAKIQVGPMPELVAYPLGLKLMFQNLISNAIKFKKENVFPVVTISATDNDDHWNFSVTDNGIGIEEKFREKVFAIFQRLHTKTQYDGTGIGLAHCQKIAELHEGKIWIESKPGEGSRFIFMIPKGSDKEITS